EALDVFAAWKGICFYAFQYERSREQFEACLTWLKEVKIPAGAVSGQERDDFKAMLEQARNAMVKEWQKAGAILQAYQNGYDKLFIYKSS
ncbi:hypothetical protein ACSTJO_00670, partial [Vibrio parahaemolyticus]